jgi:hypothetical protein
MWWRIAGSERFRALLRRIPASLNAYDTESLNWLPHRGDKRSSFPVTVLFKPVNQAAQKTFLWLRGLVTSCEAWAGQRGA